MKKFCGVYGGWELLIAGLVLLFQSVMNILFVQLYFLAEAKRLALFSGALVNSYCLFVLVLPVLMEKIEILKGERLLDFLDVSAGEGRLTFPVLSGFLGEQALGGFLGTVLILTGRTVLEWGGAVVAGIYCFVVLGFAMGITSMSLFRFVLCFSSKHWSVYGFAAFASLSIMICFFMVGVKSVA